MIESNASIIKKLRKDVIHAATHDGGAKCPVCDRLVKVYRRKFHAEMGSFLLRLVRKYQRYPRYYVTRDLYPHSNKAASDGSYLVHWGLIEKAGHVNSAQAPAASYRPTDKGLRFAMKNDTVPSHVHLLNNEVVGWSDTHTDILTVLGSKFNYTELMHD